jgi:hypothetical protein
MTELFGELGHDHVLAERVARWLSALYERGASATLALAQQTL